MCLACYTPLLADYVIFFFHSYVEHRDLHFFPTRRSSDLCVQTHPLCLERLSFPGARQRPVYARLPIGLHRRRSRSPRSEEHTSELQSLTNIVCRLLPDKKN